jgi:UDP-N-acetylmuramoyl-L-alanyl-D-glutamate--2,6-diaminopimelate ligase
MYALEKLLHGVVTKQIIGSAHSWVQSICFDSRVAKPGSMFIALAGTKVDGHAYIPQAIEAGSQVILCHNLPSQLLPAITYIVVPNTAYALGHIAANCYNHPSTKLKLVAVTGTSGKSSTVHLLYGLFKALGYRVGLISTIENKVHNETFPTTLTTPDVLEINRILDIMVQQGCQYCFMEASSHAMVQERIAGLHFAGAAFLNISHDHLDYHKTFDAYIWAKKKLFDQLPAQAFALYNADDSRGKIMMQNTKATIYSFAMKSSAHFTAKLLGNTWQGLCLRIAGKEVWFQLLGAFNAYNILAAYAIACLLQQDSELVLLGLSSLPAILGRFQYIQAPGNFGIIVDYAHKPDALEKVLIAINQMKAKQGKVITLIGCGGNRDFQKRPIMAKIAVKHSDQVIFTSDNPRYEEADAIIQAMSAGLTSLQQRKVLHIVDRRHAIKVACCLAKAGDMVLIAGKGHESYQEIKEKKIPFNDMQIVLEILSHD